MKTKIVQAEMSMCKFGLLAFILAAQAAFVHQARADDCIDASPGYVQGASQPGAAGSDGSPAYVQRASELRAADGIDATYVYLRSVEDAAQAQYDAASRDCE